MTAPPSYSAKPNTQYLRLFQEVTRTISASLDIDEVLNLIVQKVPEVVGVCAATIRLLDERGKRLILLAAHGLSEAYLNRGPVDAEAGVTQALEGTPVVIENAPNDPRIHYCAEAKAEGIRGILVAPIPIGGEVQGILRLLTRTRRIYDREEIDFVTAIAEQCGIAIENARVHEARKNQLAFFKTLVDIGKALNSTRDLGEVLDLMVTRLPEVMTLKGCTIRLLDPARQHLELVAASGLSEAYLNRGSIDDEISTHQALKGETVETFDAAAAPENRYAEQARIEGIASILAVPIMVKGRIIGVLRLLSGRPRHFTEAEINFAMAIAEQGGIAIRNASSYQQISKLVTELEQHENFLQHVINSLGAGLFVLDANRRIVMVNRNFLENRNVEEWDVIGCPCREVIGLCDRDDCFINGSSGGYQPVTRTRAIHQNGSFRHIEETISPVSIYSENGEPDFYIGTVRDITDRIKLHQEQLTSEKLQGAVEMAGTVAHELNTPMYVVSGAAELALKSIDPSDPIAGDLRIIIKNLKTIAELTRKMTRITRYAARDYAEGVKIVDIGSESEGY